jgi:hypothetical protein
LWLLETDTIVRFLAEVKWQSSGGSNTEGGLVVGTRLRAFFLRH